MAVEKRVLRSKLEVSPFQRRCPVCRDFYYVVNKHGQAQVCPCCSCPKCQRLLDVHPNQGGCICPQ